MTNATPAAGTPAADPYLRWETRGGWSAQPDQRTLERERLESRARGTDATLQLLRCFPSWTRALEQLTVRTTRAARRQRAGRPQRPGRVAQPRRPRPSGPSPPRQGEAQRHAPDFGGDHGPDRRPGSGRPRRRTRLEHRHDASERARRAAGARPRHAARRPRRSAGVGVSARSAARARPTARARRPSGGRPVAVAARQPQPVRRRRPALLADRLGHLALARRRAARGGRQGRAAGRRVRRAGDRVERRVAADAGARARHDPAGRRARRPARARPALGGNPDRQPRRAARADQRPHAPRRAARMP